ncbi:MAG TPA: tetratricopeptide repeat protein [Steroidobacteraceae bacterium]|nr:tetratricopeptide repeat protein [Steroidobacteraceae bacterium]
MRRPWQWLSMGVALAAAAAPSPAAELRDLYFGEALYQAYQGQYFDALERLDAELAQHQRVDEPQLDSLQYHIRQADFSVGDFELRYRMHLRAGRAVKAVLDADVEQPVKNEAAYRLARIEFQKDQPQDALQALERIQGAVPDNIKDDLEFLRANVYLALGRPADAVEVLKRLQGAESLKGFAAYNLGIALLQANHTPEGLRQLEKAGQIESRDTAVAAIRDKSNMVLGSVMLRSEDYAHARLAFDRVRLEGPYSNRALLSTGWADASTHDYQKSLVPWGMLIGRDSTDAAVQEAKLALPFAYSKLRVYGRAASLYSQALDSFGKELEKVDASTRSIRAGNFLKALVREEINQDNVWVVRLRTLPDTPETFYLTELMASNDFQTALHNYLDLEDLHRRLLAWQGSFDAFQDLIRLRRANYEPLLPEVDAHFKELDAQMRMRLEQRDLLQKRLQDLLTAPRPPLLATADERVALERLRKIETALKHESGAECAAQQMQVQHLQGVLTWRLYTEYPERLTQAHEDLHELNEDVQVLHAQYTAFVRARQAAVHSYAGYDQSIQRLRSRVAAALARVDTLLARQGQVIEAVAIDELNTRRQRLEAYQVQARYAVADSYDRALKEHGSGGTP